MRGLGLNVETRDVRNDPRWQKSSSVRRQTPVALPALDQADDSIEWSYESKAIIRYLEQRFAAAPA